MGLNVSTQMGFENKEFLKNAAKNILSNGGASPEKTSKIIDGTIFEMNPQLSIIKASSQISMNKSLDATLRYLKSHASKIITKKHILGELWNALNSNEINNYDGELVEFTIDMSKNIFAA